MGTKNADYNKKKLKKTVIIFLNQLREISSKIPRNVSNFPHFRRSPESPILKRILPLWPHGIIEILVLNCRLYAKSDPFVHILGT